MKITTTIVLASLLLGSLHAGQVKSPWLLKPSGAYIEMSEGRFRRASAIETVSGKIHVYYVKDGSSLLSEFYPLSETGLADLKKLDRAKFAGAKCRVEVVVYINGDLDQRLLQFEGEDPMSDWSSFQAAILDARAQVERLLELASKG